MQKQESRVEEIVLAPEKDIVKEQNLTKHNNNDFADSSYQNNVKTLAKQNVRVGELVELRENNRKVFRMSDGTEQAVFYPQNIHVRNKDTQIFEDVETEIVKDIGDKLYRSGKNNFVAKLLMLWCLFAC